MVYFVLEMPSKANIRIAKYIVILLLITAEKIKTI